MRSRASVARDVPHLPTARGEAVGDQRAMTAPPQRLRTYDRSSQLDRQRAQLIKSLAEREAQRIVGVASKRRTAPSRVGRVGLPVPPATQSAQVPIVDSMLRQPVLHRRCSEVRVAPRSRHTSHIDHQPHLVVREDHHESLQRMRRVADRPQLRPHAIHLGEPHPAVSRALARTRASHDRTRLPAALMSLVLMGCQSPERVDQPIAGEESRGDPGEILQTTWSRCGATSGSSQSARLSVSPVRRFEHAVGLGTRETGAVAPSARRRETRPPKTPASRLGTASTLTLLPPALPAPTPGAEPLIERTPG